MKRRLLWVVCLALAAGMQGQSLLFNRAEVETVNTHWTNSDTHRTTYDVVHLRGGRTVWDEFCSQMASNASIVPGSRGKWNIYTYCDPRLNDTSIGDGCCLI